LFQIGGKFSNQCSLVCEDWNLRCNCGLNDQGLSYSFLRTFVTVLATSAAAEKLGRLQDGHEDDVDKSVEDEDASKDPAYVAVHILFLRPLREDEQEVSEDQQAQLVEDFEPPI